MKRFVIVALFVFEIIGCIQSIAQNETGGAKEINVEQKASIEIPTSKKNDGKISNVSIGCSYNHGFKENYIIISLPNPREVDIINKILTYSGIPSNFKIYKASIDNAVSMIIGNQRYIVYDDKLLKNTDKATKSYWSSTSILAHLIGHHLAGHTMLSNTDGIEATLEADKFSGFVLYKMGANIEDSIKAITLLGNTKDTNTQPSKFKRIQAIKTGWNEANQQKHKAALPPSPNDEESSFYVFNSPMLINKENIKYAKEYSPDFYKRTGFLYGVITDVNKDFDSFHIRILKMDDNHDYFRDLTGEDWNVHMDEVGWTDDNKMCHACAFNFKSLIIPGRRLKFSMVEAYPGAGTIMNGVWFLTHAEKLDKI